MARTLLYNAEIITSEKTMRGSVVLNEDRIEAVLYPDKDGIVEWQGAPVRHEELPARFQADNVSRLDGLYLMAGGIDAHVHFRDPGLTGKADFSTESKAALLGGVTSVIDMPNTVPPTVSCNDLAEKMAALHGRSFVNYAFHIGATNSNAGEIRRALEQYRDRIAGIKVFMGSSTGDMLVDSDNALQEIFQIQGIPVLVHCEDEGTIRRNLEAARAKYGDDIPFAEHPNIRSRHACIISTIRAIEMAMKYGTRLHICHISTKEEADMARAAKSHGARITAETSVNYLWFSDRDYARLGGRIKCNPAIKSEDDRTALIEALRDGVIDTIGTDHAPHLLKEKLGNYVSTPSGIPSIQHSLSALLTLSEKENIPLQRISSACAEKPAEIFGINDRGSIASGRKADIVVFDMNGDFVVESGSIAYKCGWSPYEGERLRGKVMQVYLNGKKVVDCGELAESSPGGEILNIS